MSAPPATLRQIGFDSPEVRTLIAEWDRELRAAIPGWKPDGGSLVEAAEFERPHGVFLVAVAGEVPIGCGGLRALGANGGEVKRMFVRASHRGAGVGRAILAELEVHARRLELTRVRLDTHGGSEIPLRLFLSAGYEEIPRYNDNEQARYWLEKRLQPG